MRMILAVCLLGTFVLSSCQKRLEPVASNAKEQEILQVLMPFEHRLEKAWVAFQKADYDEVMGKTNSRIEEKRAKLLAIYNDEANYQALFHLHAKYGSDVEVNPDLNRTLSRWVQELSASILTDPRLKKLQAELHAQMDRMNKLRANYVTRVDALEGKDQALSFGETRQVLWKNPDRELRKRVFVSRSQMGDLLLKEGLSSLIKARNSFAREVAKARGKKDWAQYNFYRLKYEQFGLNLDETFALFDKLRVKTDLRLKKILAKAVAKQKWGQLQPWDFDYVYASSSGENPLDDYLPAGVAEANARTVFKEMGFALDAYSLDLDLYPRKGKGDNAGCFTIEAPQLDPNSGQVSKGDLRIYANLGQGGMEELSTLFHELGHAVHHAETKQFYWLDRNLERPAGTDYSLMEVPSTFFEKFPMMEEYLLRFAVNQDGSKPTEEEIRKALKAYQAVEKDQFLLGWRQLLARVSFEKAMYEADGESLAKVWSQTMVKHLHVAPADTLNAWIERPHFVAAPVYYQAYALANLGSAQIFSHLKEKLGTFIGNPQVGEELKKGYFIYGRRYDYTELVKKVTGQSLSEDALVKMSL